VRLFHPTSIRPLFSRLFDDAALFPPASAPMSEAVADHGTHTKAWYADLVRAFVCPDGRLAELDHAAQHARFGDVNIAITVPGGVAAVAEARARAAEFGWLHVRAIEVPSPAAELQAAIAMLVDRGPESVFVEIPVSEVGTDTTVALNAAGLGLKLRTGGTSASAFPTTAQLANALGHACNSGVRLKCTAGLHNAIRHVDSDTGFAHHGFLNVLWAIQLLQSNVGMAAAEEALATTDPLTVRTAVGGFSSEDAAALRGQFASIGSCSITEPLDDLVALDLVPAP
jgi:hypothetical protein